MDKLTETVRQIVHLLVNGEYDRLQRMSEGIRLSATQMATAVKDYGRTLVYPQSHTLDSLDVVEVAGAQPPRWAVVVPLWTKEEGRSDLTLELTVIEHPTGLKVEIDNLHVL